MFQKNQEVHFSWGFRICGQNSNFHLCKTTKISLAWEFMIFEKKTYTWKKTYTVYVFFFKVKAFFLWLFSKNFVTLTMTFWPLNFFSMTGDFWLSCFHEFLSDRRLSSFDSTRLKWLTLIIPVDAIFASRTYNF